MKPALLAAALALTLAGSAASYQHPASSPYAHNDLTLNFTARGLTAGDRYAATFAAYASDNDPYPYYLGHSEATVKRGGVVTFTTFIEDLTDYKSSLHEVKMWLRYPGTTVIAPPVLDSAGRPYVSERDFGY